MPLEGLAHFGKQPWWHLAGSHTFGLRQPSLREESLGPLHQPTALRTASDARLD